jgi:hypothetical protein
MRVFEHKWLEKLMDIALFDLKSVQREGAEEEEVFI